MRMFTQELLTLNGDLQFITTNFLKCNVHAWIQSLLITFVEYIYTLPTPLHPFLEKTTGYGSRHPFLQQRKTYRLIEEHIALSFYEKVIKVQKEKISVPIARGFLESLCVRHDIEFPTVPLAHLLLLPRSLFSRSKYLTND